MTEKNLNPLSLRQATPDSGTAVTVMPRSAAIR